MDCFREEACLFFMNFNLWMRVFVDIQRMAEADVSNYLYSKTLNAYFYLDFSCTRWGMFVSGGVVDSGSMDGIESGWLLCDQHIFIICRECYWNSRAKIHGRRQCESVVESISSMLIWFPTLLPSDLEPPILNLQPCNPFE